jgi:Xaa-Pro aminopeptidase
MLIEPIQEALRQAKLDGWLFFDHHRRDPLAYRILSLPPSLEVTRRWYYFIPASGEPRKLVHSIESGSLDTVPGIKQSYSRWSDQRAKLGALLAGAKRIAMQYSPDCAIPYVSMVDGGTLELVRACGVEVVTSADLVQEFEARWTQAQYESHIAAGKHVDQVRAEAFDLVRQRLETGVSVTEYDVQQFILRRFDQLDLTTNHGPIVGVNANASNPHYEPSRDNHSHIQRGDLVLIDLWAKLKQADSVYYDVTWTAFCGQPIPERVLTVFEIVKDARRRACNYVIEKVQSGQPLRGFEVDDAARSYIEEHGFGEYFFHRTGHSIGSEVHGTGANMDNFESHDDRRIIANTCFSVEPGIYLAEFGIRSEVNVYVGDGFAQVTGEQQDELVRI